MRKPIFFDSGAYCIFSKLRNENTLINDHDTKRMDGMESSTSPDSRPGLLSDKYTLPQGYSEGWIMGG